MDRTSEFFKIVDQRRSQESVVHPSRPPITRSEFTAEASEIGAAIYATADKLGKLTQLAKSKSLFEDPTAEINAMTGLIKTEIVSLNSKLSELKGRQRASRTKQRESHSTSVVESLSSQLRSATSDFKDVLHTRSANIKLLQDRRSQFSGFGGGGGGGSGGGAGSSSGCERSLGAGSSLGASAGSFGTGAGGYGAAGAVPVSIFECPAPLETCAGGSSSGGGGSVAIDMSGMMNQQQMQMATLDQNHAYIESRAHAVDAVQGTIAELGNIFQELGVLISEQGTNINIIDEEAETSLTNVNLGRDQLLRAMSRAGGNRALIIRVFAVLFFFVVLFGAFFV